MNKFIFQSKVIWTNIGINTYVNNIFTLGHSSQGTQDTFFCKIKSTNKVQGNCGYSSFRKTLRIKKFSVWTIQTGCFKNRRAVKFINKYRRYLRAESTLSEHLILHGTLRNVKK